MGVHVHPPFWFRDVAVSGRRAIEIHIVPAHCPTGHHGELTIEAAQEMHDALGKALDAARAITPAELAASSQEAVRPVPDAKTKGAGE